MPRTTVSVFNAHTKTNETYIGVLLDTLLAKVGVPQGEAVRGSSFLIGVIAEGTDGYRVLYSLAEVDPGIHAGQVIVADSLEISRLPLTARSSSYPLKKRGPARWVRNLDRISVITVNP